MTKALPAEYTVSIAAYLADAGYAGPAAVTARSVLEDAGITRPGKTGFSSTKLERASAALEAALAGVCERAECRALLEVDGREVIVVESRAQCEICGGSNNHGAFRAMAVACADAGVERMLIVGGSPRQWDALRALVPAGAIDVRFVDGTRGSNEREALQNCSWAHLVVVWAPTPLGHRVSDLYRADVCVADRVEVHRRGIEALASAVDRHLRAAPGERVRHQ